MGFMGEIEAASLGFARVWVLLARMQGNVFTSNESGEV
jgi:hypothetical protein